MKLKGYCFVINVLLVLTSYTAVATHFGNTVIINISCGDAGATCNAYQLIKDQPATCSTNWLTMNFLTENTF